MTSFLLGVAVVLLLTIMIGLWMVMRAPGRGESVLVALLAGTTGVALTLVVGEALAVPGVEDVALAFALLAAILGVAFVVRGWPADDRPGGPEERCS